MSGFERERRRRREDVEVRDKKEWRINVCVSHGTCWEGNREKVGRCDCEGGECIYGEEGK